MSSRISSFILKLSGVKMNAMFENNFKSNLVMFIQFRVSFLAFQNVILIKGWSATPKVETVCLSETVVSTYESTQQHNPEQQHWHIYCCENLKDHIVCFIVLQCFPNTCSWNRFWKELRPVAFYVYNVNLTVSEQSWTNLNNFLWNYLFGFMVHMSFTLEFQVWQNYAVSFHFTVWFGSVHSSAYDCPLHLLNSTLQAFIKYFRTMFSIFSPLKRS
jgi:hypothetical protein